MRYFNLIISLISLFLQQDASTEHKGKTVFCVSFFVPLNQMEMENGKKISFHYPEAENRLTRLPVYSLRRLIPPLKP